MKKYLDALSFSLFVVLFLILSSCNGQDQESSKPIKDAKKETSTNPFSLDIKLNTARQIGEYIVEIFEDSKGNLWFGTLSRGVACYNGKELRFFDQRDGLVGSTVVSIVEDKKGDLWFGTHSGLSKYDGKIFTNFSKKDGLCDERISGILIDKFETIWIATWGGICRLKNNEITEFPIPVPDVQLFDYESTMDWVTEIIEDKKRNIWFARDGYGACKYDGNSFTHFTKKDGLPSNNIQAIQEDKNGDIWFGARVTEKDNPDPQARKGQGGLSRYDGKEIIQYPNIKGLSKNDIYTIYEDKTGNIWIGANGIGAYRFDGQNFTLFSDTDRADLMPYGYGIQSILEDKNGNIWFGLSGGLFRLLGDSIINVTEEGPWR